LTASAVGIVSAGLYYFNQKKSKTQSNTNEEFPVPTNTERSPLVRKLSKAALESNSAYEQIVNNIPEKEAVSNVVDWKELDQKNPVERKAIVPQKDYFNFKESDTFESQMKIFKKGIK